ncbi:hypothetical protein CODIS_29270 [Candidatus Thiodiazotropha endolucinida]|uniref:Alginate export domain-containing protein n=2 Tax=Candidatus Thiodiazotropha endolucinida TaxID=1655433 RepID=A0A7Z1AF48_9GAMM|nr:hypothetical protein CODIS_29270 [Candidatus Thiodiazotropha endolucinida]
MICLFRRCRVRLAAPLLRLMLLIPGVLSAGEWSGFVELQGRHFPQQAMDRDQSDQLLSIVVQPEYYQRWDNDRQSLLFIPFLRWDSEDDERTHGDIRELIWTYAGDGWETKAGIGKVFWGVTEALHLVDIINQTDLIENPDGEQKLGQPMLKLSLEKDWGIIDLYALPGFRERTYPGEAGRLRTHPHVDTDLAEYQSDREERHIDLALRWSHFIGDWDIGIAHFDGTSRDPLLTPGRNSGGEIVLIPFYEQIRQTSLDLQATKGDWLWKLEAIHRAGDSGSYNAATGGFEYTLVGIADSDMDLGFLGEYLYDDRRDDATTPFENDLFVGLRLTANDVDDSELLAGVIKDLDDDGWMFNLEASRRIGNHWKTSAQIRLWSDIPIDDPLFTFHRDDYFELAITRFF